MEDDVTTLLFVLVIKTSIRCSNSKSKMISIVPRFTIISGGALGVDLEAEKLARCYCLRVEVLIPPCHPRSKTVPQLTSTELGEAIPTTKQTAARLNKTLEDPIGLQYIHRNYHVVEKADMVFGI